MKRSAAFACIALGFSNITLADSDTKFGVQGGYSSGGDTLKTYPFTDGSTDSIDAGAGISFGVFTLAPLEGSDNLFIKTAISYLNDNITASNGEANFTRFPLDVLLSKDTEKFQFGVGLTYHIRPNFDDTFGNYANADNALGLILEGNVKVFDKAQIGIRYTSINYNFSDVEKDGSNVAITAGYTF